MYFLKTLCRILNYTSHTPSCGLNLAVTISDIYDYPTHICRSKQRSHKMIIIKAFATFDETKTDTKKERLKLGGGQPYDPLCD
jgi:hypothetical protein